MGCRSFLWMPCNVSTWQPLCCLWGRIVNCRSWWDTTLFFDNDSALKWNNRIYFDKELAKWDNWQSGFGGVCGDSCSQSIWGTTEFKILVNFSSPVSLQFHFCHPGMTGRIVTRRESNQDYFLLIYYYCSVNTDSTRITYAMTHSQWPVSWRLSKIGSVKELCTNWENKTSLLPSCMIFRGSLSEHQIPHHSSGW